MGQTNKVALTPYILIFPAVVTLLSILLYPIISSAWMSMLDYTFTKVERPFVLFENFKEILSDDLFLSTTWRTILWTGINIMGMTILGLYTAILLTCKFKGNFIIKAVILIPWILPQVVTGFTWSWMMTQDFGILNHFLIKLRVVPEGFSWFQTGGFAFAATIIANVWRGFPFFALMLYAKISSLPKDQIEAAKIDGANSIHVFFYITVAHIRGVLSTCILLSFLWTFNAFDIIFVMTNGGPNNATLTLPLLLQREAFNNMDLGNASAMALVMLFIMVGILLFSMLVRSLFRKLKGGIA